MQSAGEWVFMKFSYLKARSRHPFPIIAWLIMVFQGEKPWEKSSTSHRALKYWIGETEWVVDSTGAKGVKDQVLDPTFTDKYFIVDEMEFELDIDPGEFCDWIDSIIGRKYDRLGIFGLALKILGFVSFNTIGHNYRRLSCNEVMVHFMEKFRDLKVVDSDNWDLNMTDQMMERMLHDVH